MFYQDSLDEPLRFGDVIRGFAMSTPNINSPPINLMNNQYKIDIALPEFCVVLSPCCSIDKKVISMSPLIQVLSAFFNNPYFEEDLTRINRIVAPEKSMPPADWNNLPREEQKKRIDAGYSYTNWNFFIYEKHDIFSEYKLNRFSTDIITKYYRIDFRHTFRVNCLQIDRNKKAPIGTKCLQLTVETRKELREKISAYYWRIPEEDKVSLATT